MEHFKRSTSRDFRINGATLEAALREASSEDDNEEVGSLFFTWLPEFSIQCITIALILH